MKKSALEEQRGERSGVIGEGVATFVARNLIKKFAGLKVFTQCAHVAVWQQVGQKVKCGLSEKLKGLW